MELGDLILLYMRRDQLLRRLSIMYYVVGRKKNMNLRENSKQTSLFVTCTPTFEGEGIKYRYANAAECVGYHADQLTYIGPHPTIASLSLGCEREV
jgi:hypothetical protein